MPEFTDLSVLDEDTFPYHLNGYDLSHDDGTDVYYLLENDREYFVLCYDGIWSAVVTDGWETILAGEGNSPESAWNSMEPFNG